MEDIENEIFKRRKDLGFSGHNSSQGHLHHKMSFISHYICLVLHLMDTDCHNQATLLFTVRNEQSSEIQGQLWVSWRVEIPETSDNLDNSTLHQTKQNKKLLSPVFPVLSDFRKSCNSSLVLYREYLT